MATNDETLSEDDDIEIIEVDAPSGEEAKAAEAAAKVDPEPPAADAGDDDEDDDDEEDARLADRDADEDSEDEQKRKRKLGQRQRQKAAKLRAEQRIATLEQTIIELRQGQKEIRDTNLSVSEGMVASRLEEVRRDIATAEAILADAVKNADGDSYTQALRLRDEAKAQEADLVTTHKGFAEARKPVAAGDPEVARLSGAWKAANAWYDVKGTDEASAVVNLIDSGMMSEGLNPGTHAYWKELTRRVTARLAENEERAPARSAPADDKRRKGPPVGDKGSGGNGNGSTTRKVTLSKDRVDAIKAAGDWDDPVERNKAIKAYEAYDREHSA